MRVPLIDNYEKFVEFNNELKSDTRSIINIQSIDYDRSRIWIDTNTTSLDLDKFLQTFVTNQSIYITTNIKLLEDYDFSRLYSQTHPEEFKTNLYDYAKNLTLIGETTFMLWDFTVEILSDGLAISKYVGSKARNHLVIPFGITEIGKFTFNLADWLKEIELPTTLKKISFRAFADSSLKRVVIPDSVEFIDKGAFISCSNLRQVELPKNLKSIGMLAFADTSITEIKLPNTLARLEAGVFADCRELTKVELPNELQEIGTKVFSGTNLKSVEIPDTTYIIDSRAFSYCHKLRNVKLPNRLQTIGLSAFTNTNIAEINIPESVRFIGYGAFSNCKRLDKVNLPTVLENVGANAFSNTPIEKAIDKKLKIALRNSKSSKIKRLADYFLGNKGARWIL